MVAMSGRVERGIILVAEDDVMVRNLVRLVLERAGFRVLAGADGLETLELSRTCSTKIELLLADENMPGMQGSELAEYIKRERPGTAILIMSGGDTHWVKECGTPYLSKPFTPDTLIATINRLLSSAAEAAACGPGE
jgi:DNA-binding response OmpR family regulator